jgi:hypothetical protein
MMAARTVARSAGPLPVRLVAVSSHVPAGRFSPSGPDSTTRAPTRDNATAGMPHLVHVDLRDLHDHVACPCLQTMQVHPHYSHTGQK